MRKIKFIRIIITVSFVTALALTFYLGIRIGTDIAITKRIEISRQNKTSVYPLSAAIEIIDNNYIKPIFKDQQEKRGVYYAIIEAIIKNLDHFTRFTRPSPPPNKSRFPPPEPNGEILQGNIGYINIPAFFDQQTPSKIKQILDRFEQKNIKGLILDVRNNPGGNTGPSLLTTSLFLEKDQMIATIDYRKEGQELEYTYRCEGFTYFKKPMVILINNRSGSGAELFCGALQDHKRAVLVGTKTFGKGLGQQDFVFEDGSVLTLTNMKFILPSGRCPQGIGIIPDIVIEEPQAQLQKAIEILKQSK